MELFLSGSSYRYECENLCRLFFPYSPVKVEAWDQPGPPSPGEGPWALGRHRGRPGRVFLSGNGFRRGARPHPAGRRPCPWRSTP